MFNSVKVFLATLLLGFMPIVPAQAVELYYRPLSGNRCGVYRQEASGKLVLIQVRPGPCPAGSMSKPSSNAPAATSTAMSQLSSGSFAPEIGFIWEYYPQNLTCHLVQYARLSPPSAPPSQWKMSRTVVWGVSGVGYDRCGVDEPSTPRQYLQYDRAIYPHVDLANPRWRWRYNPNTAFWTWYLD